MNCAEVKKWRIILGEEERETILQALGKMLFTAAFLQSALQVPPSGVLAGHQPSRIPIGRENHY